MKYIEIYWLEATVAFGPDRITDVWEVSESSDRGHYITVDRRQEDGKKMLWNIPFDVSQTLPSPSGKMGHRILLSSLDTSNLEAVEQIDALEDPPSPPASNPKDQPE